MCYTTSTKLENIKPNTTHSVHIFVKINGFHVLFSAFFILTVRKQHNTENLVQIPSNQTVSVLFHHSFFNVLALTQVTIYGGNIYIFVMRMFLCSRFGCFVCLLNCVPFVHKYVATMCARQ